ncbi:metallophosphoesterase [Terriglobus saanensis]|uniref:Metallophosphoesterase n=1 Tax=Terriglobus saanensis (strain ATCC BAA-1853 / DSM 23119 / SP1PR4) TaxID=401053 RepID=E8UX68_TERSS|nr:metallophosphoesterase [Terriglobus saanensis]ADV83031.1 metallophosphoesterase [Terriglobus saanensis SP1PR4]
MAPDPLAPGTLNRRRFLRQSFAFSAAALTSSSLLALPSRHPAKQDAAHLLMLGDWGRETKDRAQHVVAQGMIDYTQQHALSPEALLMLGDNWYDELPGGVTSPRWQSGFEQMYPQSVFNCPAYAIPGNHDYQRMPESKVTAELAYARQPHTRWTMPSLWYRFGFPNKSPLITFIALDSNVFHENGKPEKNDYNFTLTPEQQAEQLLWLKAELEKPLTTPFWVMMAHHPVFSNGPHGDHKVLIRDWDPLLREHNVHLYLAGHDHDLQHLEFEGHPTSFFLSGGGGADLYNLRGEEAARGPYAQKVHGFSHLEVTSKLMTLRHLNADGSVLHTFTKTPEGKVSIHS